MHILEVWTFFKNRNIYHVIKIYPAGQKMKIQRGREYASMYVFNRLLKQAAEQFNSLGPIPQCFKSNVYYKAWSSSCGIHLSASCLFPLTPTDTHQIQCLQIGFVVMRGD